VADDTADSGFVGNAGEAARVLESGFAHLEAGEIVLLSGGDHAQAERVIEDSRTYVQYIFPVEIEVRGAPDPVDADDLTQRALLALARGLQGLHGLGGA
jgi:hypothetical protein